MDFLPTLWVLYTFSGATLLLAITPGPDMTLFLSRTLAYGRAAGIACLLGTSTGVLIHTVLAVVGISALLAASPIGFLILKIAGALYLLWMAVQALFFGSTFNVEGKQRAPRSFFQNWLLGIGINLLNPKIVIFFLTFLPQFVTVDDPAAPQKMLFLGLYFVLLSLPFMLVVILGAEKLTTTLRNKPSIGRILDYIFAGVFGAFAIRILLEQGR